MEDFFVCQVRVRVERDDTDDTEQVDRSLVMLGRVTAADGDAALKQIEDRLAEGHVLAIPVAAVTSRMVGEQVRRTYSSAPPPPVE